MKCVLRIMNIVRMFFLICGLVMIAFANIIQWQTAALGNMDN